MAALTDLLADLDDRINDTGNTQIPKATKVRYLNHGIRATWPKLYRTVRDTSLTLAADTFEYDIPAAVGSHSKLIRLEVETETASNRYVPLFDYQLVPGLTDPIVIVESTLIPALVGSRLRITAAKQLTELVADADVYDGPAGTEELPVLYAQGLAGMRRLDDRVDYRRLSVVNGQNAVSPGVIMDVSQFSFAQFELLLDRYAMPLPTEESQ